MRMCLSAVAVFACSPVLGHDVTCDDVRHWVAKYGASKVLAMAHERHVSATDIARGMACLAQKGTVARLEETQASIAKGLKDETAKAVGIINGD